MTLVKKVIHPNLGDLEVFIFSKQSGLGSEIDISTLLSSCAKMLSESEGGHVPDVLVHNRILRHYTTVESIVGMDEELVARFYVTSNKVIFATALVARRPGLLLPEHTHGCHPEGLLKKLNLAQNRYHSVFNIAVDLDSRHQGLARILISSILEYGSAHFLGDGLLIRSEPPEHDIWQRLGFTHQPDMDEFVEGDPAPSSNYADVREFNQTFSCKCEKSDDRLRMSSLLKLKYYTFTRSFDSNNLGT